MIRVGFLLPKTTENVFGNKCHLF